MWLLFACWSTGWAEPAGPDGLDPATVQARSLYEEGRQHYVDGDYAAAIEAWKRSFALSGRTELLFNLSLAHERLGDLEEATTYMERYREVAPPSQRPKVDRQLERLRSRAEGHRAPAATGGLLDVAEPELEPSRRRKGRRTAGVALTAAGLGVLAAGATFTGIGAQARGDLDLLCVASPEGSLCPTDAAGPLDRLAWSRPAALVSLIVGGAILGSGVSLVVAPGSPTQLGVSFTVK